MMLLVTGGAGFIGSNFVDSCLAATAEPVLTVDTLTYAGNLENFAEALNNPRHFFAKVNIADSQIMSHLLMKYKPRAIVNFAAESHDDRSIHDPDGFIQTNIVGACRLLKAALPYWSNLPSDRRASFRFLQVSTARFSGRLTRPIRRFARRQPMRRTIHTRPARPPRTTWRARFNRPMAFPS